MADKQKIPSVCRSDFEVGGFLGSMLVDGFAGLTELKAADPDAKLRRGELIEAVRAGKHIALNVTARTFRQSPKSNRNYLRLAGNLADGAKTFKGMPFLIDHDTYSVGSRMGTISSSALVQETQDRIAFEQSLEVVDPDGVIRVLDGRIDRFSIGWFREGQVNCSAHGDNIRECGCWPGESVKVEGKMKTCEYVFTAWSGKETSGVNVPAVQHTNIEDIRAALAAELQLPQRKKENRMNWQRLAAALGLTLIDENSEGPALAAVEALSRRASGAEQERDEARRQLAAVQAQLTAAQAGVAAAGKVRIDALIQGALAAGKLKVQRNEKGEVVQSAREQRLRRIAAEANGIAQLEAEIAELDVIVPVGRRVAEGAREPEKAPALQVSDESLQVEMQIVADQLGLKVEDMVEFHNNHHHEGA